jgi:hypothetical protein
VDSLLQHILIFSSDDPQGLDGAASLCLLLVCFCLAAGARSNRSLALQGLGVATSAQLQFPSASPSFLPHHTPSVATHTQQLHTMSKRAHEHAFGMPGQWPESPQDQRDSAAATGGTILSTFGNLVTRALTLPTLLVQRFYRKQKLVLQPIDREDGARKKRIIDVGAVYDPDTPTPAPRTRAHQTRRGRGRITFVPTSPATWSGPLPISSSSESSESSASDIWSVPVSPTKSASPTKSTSSTNSAIPALHHWIGQHSYGNVFGSSSVFDNDVDMHESSSEFDEDVGKYKSSSEFDEDVGKDKSSSEFDEDVGMDKSSSEFDEDVGMDEPEVEDDNASLDFSFSDCWTSPVHPDDPARLLHISATPSPQKSLDPVGSPAGLLRMREPQQLSPHTHYNIIKRSTVTPMRKTLLKLQVTAQGTTFTHKPTSPTPNHTVPIPSMQPKEPTKLQQKEFQASLLKKSALVVGQDAQQAYEQHKAQAEARQNPTTDIPAEDLLRFNYVETIDQDLSHLSDAPEYDSGAQTLYSPSPPPRKRRSVRWSSHANAKPFYCDEVIADMMDSTLESINFSSPAKASVEDEFLEDDTPDDNTPEDDMPDDDESQSIAQDEEVDSDADESVGFTGVPASTWDDSDDSLEESEMSLELLAGLELAMQNMLALAPPPPPAPPAPPVKALVTPLSSEEQDNLDSVVKKTDNGKLDTMWVVDDKLYARDFGTLLPTLFNGDPKAWLNDSVVNEYLAILTEAAKKKAGFVFKKGGSAPPVHTFSSFWYPTIKNRAQGVARWAARFNLAGKQYLDAELILYPICDAGHWRLLVVKPQERIIEYLDSLGWDGTKYVNKLKEYLAAELKEFWYEDEWTVLEKQRSTRQVNGSDCGVFTVLNALALIRGEDSTKVLACDGMRDARERIATSLMAGVPTTELD